MKLLAYVVLLAVTTRADKVKRKRFVQFESSLGPQMVSLVPPEMTIHQFPDYDTDKLFGSTTENLFEMPKDFNTDIFNEPTDNKKEINGKAKDITFTKQVKVPIIKKFKVPVNQPVTYYVDKPHPMYVKKIVQIPVHKPIASYPAIKQAPFQVPVRVPMETRLPMPITNPVPYHSRVPMQIPVPDPYRINKQVPTNFPQDKYFY